MLLFRPHWKSEFPYGRDYFAVRDLGNVVVSLANATFIIVLTAGEDTLVHIGKEIGGIIIP